MLRLLRLQRRFLLHLDLSVSILQVVTIYLDKSAAVLGTTSTAWCIMNTVEHQPGSQMNLSSLCLNCSADKAWLPSNTNLFLPSIRQIKTKMAAANDLIDEEKTTALKAFVEKIYVFPSLSATQQDRPTANHDHVIGSRPMQLCPEAFWSASLEIGDQTRSESFQTKRSLRFI